MLNRSTPSFFFERSAISNQLSAGCDASVVSCVRSVCFNIIYVVRTVLGRLKADC